MIAKTKKDIKRVAFFGDATAARNDPYFQDAMTVAKLLAQNGYIIVNGGGGGIMKAATLGAKEGGGRVEIVLLDPKREPENYEGIDKENAARANKQYMTKSYKNRLDKLIEVADAFVIFKGGAGTLSEVGMTWELAKFNYGNHEPLIFFGDCWKNIIESLISDLQLEKMEQRVVDRADSAEEVLELLKAANGKRIEKKRWFQKIADIIKIG